jgi:hypothetical protein
VRQYRRSILMRKEMFGKWMRDETQKFKARDPFISHFLLLS